MLDYKILELNHSVSYGSVTLKSLQNDYVPELDLLVREAIQNSSDASLEEAGDSFKVNFTTGYFCPMGLDIALLIKKVGNIQLQTLFLQQVVREKREILYINLKKAFPGK